MRQDFETADKVLPTVPREHRTRVAHFLEKQVHCMAFIVIQTGYIAQCLLLFQPWLFLKAAIGLGRILYEVLVKETPGKL